MRTRKTRRGRSRARFTASISKSSSATRDGRSAGKRRGLSHRRVIMCPATKAAPTSARRRPRCGRTASPLQARTATRSKASCANATVRVFTSAARACASMVRSGRRRSCRGSINNGLRRDVRMAARNGAATSTSPSAIASVGSVRTCRRRTRRAGTACSMKRSGARPRRSRWWREIGIGKSVPRSGPKR